MTLNVSSLGITGSNPYSRVDYLSYNERADQSPVNRVEAVGRISGAGHVNRTDSSRYISRYEANGKTALRSVNPSDSSNPATASRHMNEVQSFERAKAVSRADSVKPQSVTEQARKNYVIKTTPAYNVSFTSAGRAALETFKLKQQNLTEMSARLSLNETNKEKPVDSSNRDEQDTTYSVESAGITREEQDVFSVDAKESRVDDTPETTKENTASTSETGNLGRYTDYQLKQLVSEGKITQAEMNTELSVRAEENTAENTEAAKGFEVTQSAIFKNAVAAYNFQMSYQINALAMQ